jgi:hypothetical protein
MSARQSLGELAKKVAAEKASKENAKDGAPRESPAKDKGEKAPSPAKPKAYTNADLKAEPAPTPTETVTDTSTPPGPAKAASGTPSPGEATTEDPKKTERYWKDRMQVLETRLHDHETQLAAAQLQVREVERFIRDDGTMSSTIADNLLRAKSRVSELLGAVVNDKRAIGELEEEGRRANVPPGWLRTNR